MGFRFDNKRFRHRLLFGAAGILAPLVAGAVPACAYDAVELPAHIGYVGPAPTPKGKIQAIEPVNESAQGRPIEDSNPKPAEPVTTLPKEPDEDNLPPTPPAATPPAPKPSIAYAEADLPAPIGYVGPAPTQNSKPAKPVNTISAVSTATTQPKQQKKDGETLITAQKMTSDDATGIVTASGKVEIAHGDHVLHADKVTYDQKTGVVHADGHVAMLLPSGEVLFADSEDVTGDMKQAFIEKAGILFPDNSRLAANTIQRYDGRYIVADKGIYTSCNICAENPDNPPLWQLRAKQIVHDNVEHDIYYHDATVDFAGVPVLYTPYLSTPDPTVKRRQGFLMPMAGETPTLGGFVRTPYYFDISPDMDAVLAPTFSQTDKLQMNGNIRKRFANGGLMFDGSVTYADLVSTAGVDEGKDWRGHLIGNFLYNIDNKWRAGTDIAFSSDKSYLLRYRYSSADELTNRVYAERFSGRNYAGINSYYFEDLRPGTQPVQPLVLPQASFNMLGDPGRTLGGRWSFDGDTLVTARDNANQGLNQQGPNTRKLAFQGGWERQFISNTGLLATVSGLARMDNYWADNVINPNNPAQHFNDVVITRPFEQANVVMRYPLGRSGDGYQQLLEPIIAVTAAPVVHADNKQPIEESLNLQFDETNLFSPNRFTGWDLIEGGSRVTYGLRHSITTDSGGRVDMFGGQSYDFSRNTDFPDLSGLQDHQSDYVGRIDFAPVEWVNMNYGFRFDHQTFSPQRQDAYISAGASVFRPYARYISAYQTQTTGLVNNVQELILGFDSHFSDYWWLHAEHTQAFSPQPGPRSSNLTLSYSDECFIFGVTASHDDTSRADVGSGTSVVFHLYLKNLGGFHTDSFSTATFQPQFRQTQ